MAMSIAEFTAEPDRMKAYGNWLADPVTKELLDMARDLKIPAPLKDVRGESALYQYGLVEGASLIITFLTKMDELVKQSKIAEMMAEDPTYGAEKILKEKYT